MAAAEAPDAAVVALAAARGARVIQLLGSGCFADVWQVQNPDHTSSALKVYTQKYSPLSKEQLLEVAKAEFAAVGQLQHPHIVRVLSFINEGGAVAAVHELMAGGDLLGNIKPGVGASGQAGCEVLLGVSAGLHFLHETVGLVHHDLKCENVLVSTKFGAGAPGPVVAKLADFDAAVRLGQRVSRVRGTADAHPPEYIAPAPESGYAAAAAADVWALGLLAHILLAGRYAWDLAAATDAKYATYLANARSALPSRMPSELEQLMLGMLAPDPAARLTVSAAAEQIGAGWPGWVAAMRGQRSKPAKAPPRSKGKSVGKRVKRMFGLGRKFKV